MFGGGRGKAGLHTMADSLEFPEVFEENRGTMCSGKLKLAAGAITFKNSKTGKLDQYQSDDVKAADWLKRARGFCLKLRLENDLIHRYDGFSEPVSDFTCTRKQTSYKHSPINTRALTESLIT